MKRIALLAIPVLAGIVFGVNTASAAPHFDLSSMDAQVKPGDDFFMYANGAWVAGTEIPADRSTYSRAARMAERTAEQVNGLILQLDKTHPKPGSDNAKVLDYYMSYLDGAAIEARGLAPLNGALAEIAEIKSKADLAKVLGSQLRADVDVLNATNLATPNLFGLWVAQDLDDPSRNLPFILQGGLLMPSRDYYVGTSQRMADLREKYVGHISRMLTLAGIDGADAKAAAIMALETKIATSHWSTADTFEIEKANNHWAHSDFATKAPGLDWDAYFAAAGLGGQKDFVAWQPDAITGSAALVASEPLDVWKDYLVFHAIATHASVLPKAFGDASFAFNGTALSGTPKQRDRWKRAVDATSAALPDQVGRLYVAKYFPPAAKAEIEQMVRNLIAAFDARIDKLSWMSASTKAEAKAKLKVLKVGVGYPDKWSDVSGLKIVRGDAFGNLDRAGVFELHQALARLGKKVDRDLWVMSPQTVNAVNLPALNALNFPAAYLQVPTYDPKAPASSNYGAIGSTIGHEISHSFDNGGALFDSSGKLRNWWTPEDFAHFTASGEQLAAQFDSYKPFPDAAVNGKQTLGENIADVAGLLTAFDAYNLSLKGKPAPKIDGFTGAQQFFLAYAIKWQYKAREPALRRQLLTDGHAPAMYRALTVRNLDGWYDAFAIPPDAALYLAPDRRVRVW